VALNNGGVGKQAILKLNASISRKQWDIRPKLLLMCFSDLIDSLTPRSMTLDDLELYNFKFSENFAGFRRFRTQQQLNDHCQRQRCKQLNVFFLSTLCSLRSFAVDFFARGLHTRTAVARLP